jgi:hypothetical protein
VRWSRIASIFWTGWQPILACLRALHREIRDRGYKGAYSSLTEYLRQIRPPVPKTYERRFETDAGVQAQVDFAEFQTVFTSESGVVARFGYSVWCWATVAGYGDVSARTRAGNGHALPHRRLRGDGRLLRGNSLRRMKTAVIGEDAAGVVTYNASLVALLAHYGSAPRPANRIGPRPRAKSNGPSATSARISSSAAVSAILMTSTPSSTLGVRMSPTPEHATTGRIVQEHFQRNSRICPLPALRYDAVADRRAADQLRGLVAVAGNYYSVPDTARRRVVEVQHHTHEVRIFEEGNLLPGILYWKAKTASGSSQVSQGPASETRRDVARDTAVPSPSAFGLLWCGG